MKGAHNSLMGLDGPNTGTNNGTEWRVSIDGTLANEDEKRWNALTPEQRQEKIAESTEETRIPLKNLGMKL